MTHAQAQGIVDGVTGNGSPRPQPSPSGGGPQPSLTPAPQSTNLNTPPPQPQQTLAPGQGGQGQQGQGGGQRQPPPDPWAQVDADRSQATGDAGNWLSNALGSIGREMGFSGASGPGGNVPNAPAATRKDQSPEVQQRMSQDAFPIVMQDLSKKIPPGYIMQALLKHGLTRQNASAILVQAQLQLRQQQPQGPQQPQGDWGGS